jgi:hypothetical protein
MNLVSNRYQPNTARVAAKVMDGEAVIIDLVTGTYYSLANTGGRIWQLIEAALTMDEMAQQLAADYGIPHSRATGDIEALLAKLAAEHLIVPVTNAEGGARPILSPRATDAEYVQPELQIYRDMQDLLALDPPMPGLQDIPWQ